MTRIPEKFDDALHGLDVCRIGQDIREHIWMPFACPSGTFLRVSKEFLANTASFQG